MKLGLHILNMYGQFICEMVSWQISKSVKKLIPNLTKYKIYSWKLGYDIIKWIPTRYLNTYKTIYSINELINDIVI